MAIPKTLKAACVVLENEIGQVLVFKRTDNGKYGLPGGGVEENETFEQAAIRETYEETGIRVGLSKLLYKNKCGTVDCETFLGYIIDDSEIATHKHEGTAEWKNKEVLQEDQGSFPEYNTKVIEVLNGMKVARD